VTIKMQTLLKMSSLHTLYCEELFPLSNCKTKIICDNDVTH
jgi:hypothetical protein